MNEGSSSKVTAGHLKREAYLYVRQSSLQQVVSHTEGRRRQYDLRERALGLGWAEEQIVVIDHDQGMSGATADRAGFQRLVADVGLGRAGVVMGLEVSRLARNSVDWHRLLEICGLTDTLILDEDGLYDPRKFNDRLLLGLKGTMSEAELHLIRARLQGGIRSKARRGELRSPLPLGFVYDEDRVVLHPDQQVRETIRLFFRTFRRVGTALGTVKAFLRDGIAFPRQAGQGPRTRREILWGELDFATAWRLLRNPRYAGVYFWGSSIQRQLPGGKWIKVVKPEEEWEVFLPDAHEGYITLEEYRENRRRLSENAQAIGAYRRRTPAREGPGLLQGLAVCGRCSRRMQVRYSQRRKGMVPVYHCSRKIGPTCQNLDGTAIDEAVGGLLLELVSPMMLDVSLRVEEELERRLEEADRLRQEHVERARYEAELARQRFLHVDPLNRLVAATLEGEWNEKLRALNAAQDEVERRREEDRKQLTAEERDRILALAEDFPALWTDPATPPRERKRMMRLLVEDVTLLRGEEIEVHVRFRGGATRSLTLPPPKRIWDLRRIEPQVIAEIDRLLDDHPEDEIAELLNARGFVGGGGTALSRASVGQIRRTYGLESRAQRLRVAGFKTITEIAQELHVGVMKVAAWRDAGHLDACRVGGGRYFFAMPSPPPDQPQPLDGANAKCQTSPRGAV